MRTTNRAPRDAKLNGKRPFKKRLLKQRIKNSAPARIRRYDPVTGIMTISPLLEDLTLMQQMQKVNENLGGSEGSTEFFANNPAVWYGSVLPRMIPLQIAGEGGGPVQVEIIDPTQGVTINGTATQVHSAIAGRLAGESVPGTAVQGDGRRNKPDKKGRGDLAEKGRKR